MEVKGAREAPFIGWADALGVRATPRRCGRRGVEADSTNSCRRTRKGKDPTGGAHLAVREGGKERRTGPKRGSWAGGGVLGRAGKKEKEERGEVRWAGPGVEFWATGKKRKKREREKEMGLLGLIQEEEKEMALHF